MDNLTEDLARIYSILKELEDQHKLGTFTIYISSDHLALKVFPSSKSFSKKKLAEQLFGKGNFTIRRRYGDSEQMIFKSYQEDENA